MKRGAAELWVAAVNADGRHGCWRYGLALNPSDVVYLLDDACSSNAQAAERE